MSLMMTATLFASTVSSMESTSMKGQAGESFENFGAYDQQPAQYRPVIQPRYYSSNIADGADAHDKRQLTEEEVTESFRNFGAYDQQPAQYRPVIQPRYYSSNIADGADAHDKRQLTQEEATEDKAAKAEWGYRGRRGYGRGYGGYGGYGKRYGGYGGYRRGHGYHY